MFTAGRCPSLGYISDQNSSAAEVVAEEAPEQSELGLGIENGTVQEVGLWGFNVWFEGFVYV
jgi:hypothetical protein